MLFGGADSRVRTGIAERLPNVPLILMCRRNGSLADDLRSMRAQAPRVVLDHTPDVARWKRLADFFIGKPGPGSLSEAVHMGLPVIVTRNSLKMPQERWNTDWVRQNGVGAVHKSFRTVGVAVSELLQRLPGSRRPARGHAAAVPVHGRGRGWHALPVAGAGMSATGDAGLYFANVDAQGAVDSSTLQAGVAGVSGVSGVKSIATKWLRAQAVAAA